VLLSLSLKATVCLLFLVWLHPIEFPRYCWDRWLKPSKISVGRVRLALQGNIRISLCIQYGNYTHTRTHNDQPTKFYASPCLAFFLIKLLLSAPLVTNADCCVAYGCRRFTSITSRLSHGQTATRPPTHSLLQTASADATPDSLVTLSSLFDLYTVNTNTFIHFELYFIDTHAVRVYCACVCVGRYKPIYGTDWQANWMCMPRVQRNGRCRSSVSLHVDSGDCLLGC